MARFVRYALLPLVLLFASTMHGWAQQTRLSVMVYRGGQNLPLFVAQEEGFFLKRGLSVDLINAPNADELPKGLVDGRWQIIHSTSDNAVRIVDVEKLSAALIIGGDNAHNHVIVQNDIKSFADLKGKTIVLDGADTGYAYVIYAILEKYGLKNGDYNINLVGATPKRLEALLNDPSNKAGMINPPFSIQAVRAHDCLIHRPIPGAGRLHASLMGPRAQRHACGLSPILYRGGALDAGQSQQSEGYRDLGKTPVPHARRSGGRLRDHHGRYRRVCARWKIRHRGFQERARAARSLRGQATARSAALPGPLIL